MSLLGGFVVPHPPLIIPQIGRGEEQEIIATIAAYRKVSQQIAALKPETIVIISPHATTYADYIHVSPGVSAKGSFARFGCPEVELTARYDQELITAIEVQATQQKMAAGTHGEQMPELDHGTLIPLYFIEQKYQDYQVVRIGISGLNALKHYQFGQCLSAAIEQVGKSVVIIASGDLSHKLKSDGPYGYTPEGPEFDRQVTDALVTGDFLKLLTLDHSLAVAAAECGLRPILIMAGTLDGWDIKPQLLAYESTFGVGYAVASMILKQKSSKRQLIPAYHIYYQNKSHSIRAAEDEYVHLARQSLEHYILTNKKMPRPSNLLPELVNHQAGVFVSLHLHGSLRGCIGTIAPVTDCIADEIIRNAVSAATADPRFDPVTATELVDLEVSVDVLGAPEPIQNTAELDPKRYGVIVSSGRRKGLLLPNLDGVDTAEEQVDIALRKAGIGSKEQYDLQRFEVVRHT